MPTIPGRRSPNSSICSPPDGQAEADVHDRSLAFATEPSKAVAFLTFQILVAGFICLKLCQLILQTALYRLAFLQSEAEIVEERSVTMQSTIAISRRCGTPSAMVLVRAMDDMLLAEEILAEASKSIR